MFSHRNTEQKHHLLITKKSFENVAKFKYLGTAVISTNIIHKEIKSTLNSRNACYHSVRNPLSSRLLSKNLKFFVYNTIILHVWCGCETWSVTLREGRRLRVFENRVLRRIFGHKREELAEGWKILHNVELQNLYTSQSIMRMMNSRNMRWAGHIARRGVMRNSYKIFVRNFKG
jgi:hypothetical protein